MEKSGKIEDGVMDHLLQGFVKRQMKPDLNCESFDPDLASAYLERVMTEREQTRYESHLSDCTLCRKSVIALARLVEAEVAEVKVAAVAAAAPASLNQSTVDGNTVKPVSETQANWLARLKAWLGVWATPRFALAAAAALVLAVTIPFVLIQNSKVSKSDMASATTANEDGKAVQQAAPSKQAESNPPSNNPNNPGSDNPASPAANKQQNGETKPSATPPAAGAQPAEPASGETPTGAASNTGKEEAVAADKAKNETAKPTTDTAGGTTQPEAAKPQADEKRNDAPGRIDPNEANRISNDKDASSPTTLKQGNKTTGPPREGAVRPESPKPAAPRQGGSEPPPRVIGRDGRGFIRPSSESSRERTNASASRRIGKKTFWLVDDTWTDENYRSDKEMPIVPLIKDSENYKNILEKYSDLKKFFSAFGANERAIIVRKDMVYKLIPQDGNK